MIVKCISVKNPWAYAILNLGKDIENRSRATYYRGRVYIHASKIPDSNGITRVLQIGNSIGAIYNDMTIEEMMDNNGFIIGYAELFDCRKDFPLKNLPPNPWAEPNCWHWYLRNQVKLMKPVPASGRLGFWDFDVPKEWEKVIER